jgi:tetrahydromethanopterin S-methyltransferase subunit A
MLKVAAHPDYPPENEIFVKTGIESGAALSGTIQTENIGFEKVVCNVVANPNIRYMIVGGPESEGHLTGEALKALIRNGVDKKMRIRDTSAPHPFLYNLPMEFIDRFRKQLSVIDLQFEGDPDLIRHAVWSCYQENALEFRGYSLFDPGAFPEQPHSGKITVKVTNPWIEKPDEKEHDAIERAKALIAKLKDRSKKK